MFLIMINVQHTFLTTFNSDWLFWLWNPGSGPRLNRDFSDHIQVVILSPTSHRFTPGTVVDIAGAVALLVVVDMTAAVAVVQGSAGPADRQGGWEAARPPFIGGVRFCWHFPVRLAHTFLTFGKGMQSGRWTVEFPQFWRKYISTLVGGSTVYQLLNSSRWVFELQTLVFWYL
jgi:hypothetical protein